MCEAHLYMIAGYPDMSFTHSLRIRASLMDLQNFMGCYMRKTESLNKEQRSHLLTCMCQCWVCNVDC